MDARAAALRWAQAWERSWREHDPELLLPVYAEGVEFRSSPFRDPQHPVAYATRAYESEEAAEPRFAEPLAEGDRAAVEWWTTVVDGEGAEATIAGCSFLRFDAAGRVVEEHGYWNDDDGHRVPFHGWGRPDG